MCGAVSRTAVQGSGRWAGVGQERGAGRLLQTTESASPIGQAQPPRVLLVKDEGQ